MEVHEHKIPDQPLWKAVHQQIRYCWELNVELAGIRITPHAMQHSITALAVSPERARVLGTLMPSLTLMSHSRPLWEMLIHPEDWAGILKEAPHEYLDMTSPVTRFMGLAVRQ